jgi:energy-coupling factor transport system substrate-specific component
MHGNKYKKDVHFLYFSVVLYAHGPGMATIDICAFLDTIKNMDSKNLFSINRRMLIGTIIGAALFTLLSYFVMLPTPIPGTFFFPSYALLGFFAALFGPVSGTLISLTGMVTVSLLRGLFFERFTLAYTIAAVVCGGIYGLAKKYVHADRGEFGYNGAVTYNVVQIAGNLVSWGLVAPALNLLLDPGRPAAEVFVQGITAGFVDILSAEFIGTPLLFAYSIIRKKQLRAIDSLAAKADN